MSPAANLDNKKTRRPRTAFDFDRRPGLPHLVCRSTSPERSIWTPSWWLNVTFLLLTGLMTIPAVLLYLNFQSVVTRFDALSLWAKIAASLVGIVSAGLLLLFASESITRSRLVVDRCNGELRITSGIWFWQRTTLALADIRELRQRRLDQTGPNADGDEPVTSNVIYAEFPSGELVMIALNPDRRQGDLYHEIKNAIAAAGVEPDPNLSGVPSETVL